MTVKWMGFRQVGKIYTLSFSVKETVWTPFVILSWDYKWWIPHFEIWDEIILDTYMFGWLFLYFGVMKDK